MKKYKARVSKRYLIENKGNPCLYGISIGNPNQSGEKLEATIDFINNNFDECIIGISDTLQIPNYLAMGFSRENAREKAIQDRDVWLSENGKALEKIKIKHIVQLWDETMSLPCRHGGLTALLEEKYKSDLYFRSFVDIDVQNFVSRNPNFLNKEFLSREFLFTEIDGYSRIGQAGRYIKIYPSTPLESFVAIQSKKFFWALHGMQNLCSARIYFDKVSEKVIHERDDFKLAA